MLVGAVSEECYHCVAYREVSAGEEVGDFMKTVSGTVCLLCGVRTKTFWLVMDSSVVAAVKAGESPFGEQLPGGFEEFGRQRTAGGRGSSSAAGRLRGQLSGQADSRRRAVLEAVSEMVRADYSFDGGQKALEAGDKAKATEAFTICAGTGKPVAYRAAFRLGELATEEGRDAAAIKWQRQAAQSDEPDVRACGFLYLGIALRKVNRADEGLTAFRSAVDCGATPVRGLAAFRVGETLHDLGQLSEARRAYEYALALKTGGSADAALNLGALEEVDGNWDRARKLAEQAYASKEPHIVQLAAFNLGRCWEHRRRKSKARKYYELAARGDDHELAMRARTAVMALR